MVSNQNCSLELYPPSSSELLQEETKPCIKIPKRAKLKNFTAYIKCFFDLGYLIFLVSYRFKLKETNGNKGEKVYTIQSNKLHKVICFIFQMLIVAELLLVLRLIPNWSELNANRINILHSGNLIACLLYSVALIYMFWKKKEAFLKILEQLHEWGGSESNEGINDEGANNIWTTFVVNASCYGLCLLSTVVSLTHPIVASAFVFPEDQVGSFYQTMKMQAKACFLMADLENLEAEENNESIIYSAATFIFTIVHILLIVPSTVLVHALDLIALLTTICCWKVGKCFLEYCKQENSAIELNPDNASQVVNRVLSKYSKWKIFIDTVNGATGLVFLCCIGISLPLYASWTAVLFFEEKIDWFDTVHFCVYFVTFLVVLTLAGSVNKMANEFYNWITTSILAESMSQNKLTSLMMDMYSTRCALSGNGVFVLTFRFFVTILSIIVTYTSIIVQLQISRKDETSNVLMNNTTSG